MSNFDNLHRRVDRIQAHFPKKQTHTLKMHLFAPDEQAQLNALLASLSDVDSLQVLTAEQLEQLENWLLLEQSLDGEDVASAEHYRQSLQQGVA